MSIEKKLFFMFEIIAIVLAALIFLFFLIFEYNALNAIIGTILIFLTVYFFLATVVVLIKFSYQQDLKLVITLIPGIMTVVGIGISFWCCYENLGGRLGIFSLPVIVSSAALFIMPLMTILLDREVCFGGLKMYFLSLAQIIITGAVYWLEYSLFYY